jgi:hypothetical protein
MEMGFEGNPCLPAGRRTPKEKVRVPGSEGAERLPAGRQECEAGEEKSHRPRHIIRKICNIEYLAYFFISRVSLDFNGTKTAHLLVSSIY